MNNKVLKDFKVAFSNITNYYQQLIKKTRENEIVGSINEWIVDNYYIISEQEKFVTEAFSAREIRKINNKRKIELYNILYGYLKANDFKTDLGKLFEQLSNYQDNEKDYFSYAEINYIYVAFRLILVAELSHLSDILNNKLIIKDEVDKLFIKFILIKLIKLIIIMCILYSYL